MAGTAPALQPGLAHRQTLRVTESLCVQTMTPSYPGFADLPQVFATAFMVGFMEWTCLEALRPYMAAGETSVGVGVDVSHVAATPPGMQVSAEVELVEVNGRQLTFKVACFDEAGLIGEGLHKRAIITRASFDERLARKAAGVAGA